MPVLRIRPDDLPEAVLVVGDQDRAEWIAERLDEAEELGRYREYLTIRGRYLGMPLAVASHGVGSGGAAICFEELCRAGARRIVRLGTAGGMQSDVRTGHVVVVMGAVRDDGFTEKIVPRAYPAIPSQDLTRSVRASLGHADLTVHTGIVLSSAVFYPHDVLGSNLELWQRAHVSAVEQECAALFVVADQHRVEAAAILVIDGNPLADDDIDMTGYDPHRSIVREGIDRAARVALDALVHDRAQASSNR